MKFKTTPDGTPYEECWKRLLQILGEHQIVTTTTLSPEDTYDMFVTQFQLPGVPTPLWTLGYQLPCNSSTTHDVAKDKFATWLVLKHVLVLNEESGQIRLVPHTLIPSCQLKMAEHSPLVDALTIFPCPPYSSNVVIKPTKGMGGNKVSMCRNVCELESVLLTTEAMTATSFVMTPFIPSVCEYRVIVSGTTFTKILRKDPLTLTGVRGMTVVQALATCLGLRPGVNIHGLMSTLEQMVDPNTGVFSEDTVRIWKYNQSQGSRVSVLEQTDDPAGIRQYALTAAKVLGLHFGCVDFLYNADANLYHLLEVNSEILTDVFDYCSDSEIKRIAEECVEQAMKMLTHRQEQRQCSAVSEVSLHGLLSNQPSAKSTTNFSQRAMTRKSILQKYAAERGLDHVSFREDFGYLQLLVKKNVPRDVVLLNINQDYGTNLQCMVESTHKKSLTFYLLSTLKIPVIEHILVRRPLSISSVLHIANTRFGVTVLDDTGVFTTPLVVKSETGSGGSDAYVVNTCRELQQAMTRLSRHDFNIGKFYESVAEYRVIMLGLKVVLITKKFRPCVIGDGMQTLRSLATAAMPLLHAKVQTEILAYLSNKGLDDVVVAGKAVPLSWQYNLQAGAQPCAEDDPSVLQKLEEIGQACVRGLGIQYCAVDVLRLSDEGGLVVMEINSSPGYHELLAYLGPAGSHVVQNLLQAVVAASVMK